MLPAKSANVSRFQRSPLSLVSFPVLYFVQLADVGPRRDIRWRGGKLYSPSLPEAGPDGSVNRSLFERPGPQVAVEAFPVVVGLVKKNRVVGLAEILNEDVAQSVQPGTDAAEHRIVSVTGIAGFACRDAMVLKVRGRRGRSGRLHTNCGRLPRKFCGATVRWIAADSETNGRVTAGKFVAPGLERRAVNRPACPNRANNIRRHETRGCSLPGQPVADRF